MGAFVQELLRFGLYKKNQGRIARQATFAALAILAAMGAWSLSGFYQDRGPTLHYTLPGLLLLAGLWVSFRVVQLPEFADFLIAVEGEMNKVSWPSRGELFRASLVVIAVIFFLAALLFTYDVVLEMAINSIDRFFGWVFG